MDASERWQILRLHVEDGIPLAALARETGIGLRTLERWHHRYKSDGTPTPPAPAAIATRRVAAALVTFTERLALTRPRPSIATLHRLVATEAGRTHQPAPSYATVRRIVAALDPAMVTLALEGPASYRDRHEIVLRRRADRPNAIWQADHTQLDIGTAARIGDSSSSRRQCDGRVHDGLELDGRQTAQAGLTASAVVGPFDPGDHRDAQLLAGGPGAAVEDVLL